MASCDLQATRSQEGIVNDEPSKNLKDTEIEEKKGSSGVTKIPGPVMLDASGSFISLSNRQYTSVMELAKRQSELRNSLHERNTSLSEKQNSKENETVVEKDLENNLNLLNQTDDSGVLTDSSVTDATLVESDLEEMRTSSPDQKPELQNILDEIPSCSTSQIDLQRAEQQSLRELQRAVAEMEADVAAHSEALELEIEKQRELEQQQLDVPEPEIKADSTTLPQSQLVSHNLVAEDLLVENSVTIDLEINDSGAHDLETTDSEAHDSGAQDLEGHDSEAHDSETYEVEELVAEDLVKETSIDKDFVDHALVATPLMEQDAQEKPIEEKMVKVTIHARLTPASSTTGSTTDRKMVRLEQLLDAENNIDLLRQLLDSDTFNDVVDSNETDTADTELDKAKIKDEEKPSSFLQALQRVLCSRKIVQPLVICGLAVGLIYFLRKL